MSDPELPESEAPSNWKLDESPASRQQMPFISLLLHALAWVLTCGLVVFWILISSMMEAPQTQQAASVSISSADEMAAKMLLGLNDLSPGSGPMLEGQVAPWEISDNPGQRLGYVIMISELGSPEAGVQALERLHESVAAEEIPDLPESYPELLKIVGELLFAEAAGEAATPLSQVQLGELEKDLGFLGKLLHARAVQDTAVLERIQTQMNRAAFAILGVIVWFLVMGFSGLVALILMFVLMMNKTLKFRFRVSSTSSSIYMETFAAWLLLFIGLQTVPSIILMNVLDLNLPPNAGLLIGLAGFFLSLLALGWPLLRGYSFSRVCADIGLVPGRFFIEILAGVVTYAAAIPLLLVGAICFAVLSALYSLVFGAPPEPTHPIQESLTSGATGIILTYLLACVAAPIVEETMFRGVLYRYLRDISRRWLWFFSFLLSALVSSFIFAVIHPQGILFVPVLGALAVAFCIGREWRGSLVAPMVAHGLSNAVIMTLNVLIMF
ncbi:MAG: type II CAAX endopeptidase family protein [Phycisphaerales bacterium]|nr:type II CAAX endopeptidase family protein [Phycisphaerales bacterium]